MNPAVKTAGRRPLWRAIAGDLVAGDWEAVVEGDVESLGFFAFSLEYLALTVGAETPTQLRVIARALRSINWYLPSPEPLTPDRRICGYGECLARRAVRRTEENSERRLPHARGLFEPISRPPAIKKI
jgi:hypothetical protein